MFGPTALVLCLSLVGWSSGNSVPISNGLNDPNIQSIEVKMVLLIIEVLEAAEAENGIGTSALHTTLRSLENETSDLLTLLQGQGVGHNVDLIVSLTVLLQKIEQFLRVLDKRTEGNLARSFNDLVSELRKVESELKAALLLTDYHVTPVRKRRNAAALEGNAFSDNNCCLCTCGSTTSSACGATCTCGCK